jgi:hypothetical protein
MYDVLTAYMDENEDKDFAFMHCFKIVRNRTMSGPLSMEPTLRKWAAPLPLGNLGQSPNRQQEGKGRDE